jgi:hypothetical protein
MGTMAATRTPYGDFEEPYLGRLPGDVTGPQITSFPNLWSDTSVQIIRAPMQLGRSPRTLTEAIETGDAATTTRHNQTLAEDGHQTTTAARIVPVVLLKEAAEAGDRRRFAQLVEMTDWSTRPPEELTKAIDLALSLEMATLAIKLAQLGGRLFPEHERVQRAARVLAPPVVRSVHPPRARGLGISMAWLSEHADEYRGRWVAVREGQLLGVADSLGELMPLIGEGEDAISTLVTRVLP